MKRLFTLCFLLSAIGSFGQVGVGTTTPNAKAVLDISGTGKGLLIPRMDSATRVGITTPLPDGLMVFQTDGRKGFWYAVSNTWLYIPDKLNSGDNLGSHSATTNLAINDYELYLRAPTDTFHGLGFYGPASPAKTWLGQISTDGPVLYGNTGGVLGTKGGGSRQAVLSWNRNGRVGINNQSPQQALDVTGTARAQQFVYTSPQTSYLSLPFEAFSSSDEASYKMYENVQSFGGGSISGYMWLNGGTAGQPGYVTAPIVLPQGAIITNMELTAQDNDATSVTPQVSLSGVGAASGSIAVSIPLFATASLSAESPNWQVVSASLNHTVRNDLYAYKVTVRLNQNNSETKLHRVLITYTIANP